MGDAIGELLRSKKFLMAIIGMIAFGLAKKGINLDTEATFAFLSPILTAIIGQGVADHGKSAAQIAAGSPGAVAPSSSAPPPVQAGNARVNLLLVLAAIAFAVVCGIQLAGCAGVSKAAHDVAGELEDCTVGPAARVVHEAGPLMDVAFVQAIGPGGKVDYGPIKALGKSFTAEIGGCLVADAVARALKAIGEPAGGPRSSPLEVDKASLLTGFAELKLTQFGGKGFHTASGDI